MEENTQEKVQEKIQDADRVNLNFAQMNKKIALLNAEKAIAQHENTELNYRYLVLQLYVKYGLTQEDTIDENGNIIRGGAKA